MRRGWCWEALSPMPWASTAIRCDHFAIAVFSALSFAFAADGAERASATRQQSTTGALRLGAGRASNGVGLVVALAAIVLVVAVALLTLLVVLTLGVTLLVVALLVVSLVAHVLRSCGDGIRGVFLGVAGGDDSAGLRRGRGRVVICDCAGRTDAEEKQGGA